MSLIVCDAEHMAAGRGLCSYLEDAENAFLQMSSIMAVASEEALVAGKTADNFKSFVETVKAFEDQFIELGNDYKALQAKFVEEIDELDQDIY